MARNFPDLLQAFCDYASYTEAPRRLHFWSGVSMIAGALRRRVYIDQVFFRWFANFYILIVAPPGIVSKSTTADMGAELLAEVPGVKFGPHIVTWQSLATSLANAKEMFQIANGDYLAMSAITCVASELGNLLNPQDKDMVNLLITTYDGRKVIQKETKLNGNDTIENVWVNLIGCTTPHWISDNVPSGMIGGGFTSRCIFIYAEDKDKTVAYLKKVVPADHYETRDKLIQDLTQISTLVGEYELTEDAFKWGTTWYDALWGAKKTSGLDDELFGGYLARKQTHLHKLAMIVAASQRDTLSLEVEDLMTADAMLTDMERDIPKVFARIGKSPQGLHSERFIQLILRRKAVPYEEAYRSIHSYFPDCKDFEGIVHGAIKAGYITLQQRGPQWYLTAPGYDFKPLD